MGSRKYRLPWLKAVLPMGEILVWQIQSGGTHEQDLHRLSCRAGEIDADAFGSG